ncbi:MAG TPA: zinc ribbon domain-containing protein [Candidatus Binataceae bacterium]|nr:zinc ribbon domain-containing protein [Candidatus Binataceae bacterium]
MPIYEYQCPKCGVFEVTQRITESPLKKCPTCKAKVERILSRSSFVLKGSGWYATDYGKKPSSAPAETTNGDSSSKSESKSDSSKSEPAVKSDSSAKSDTSSKSSSEKSSAAKAAD